MCNTLGLSSLLSIFILVKNSRGNSSVTHRVMVSKNVSVLTHQRHSLGLRLVSDPKIKRLGPVSVLAEGLCVVQFCIV